MDEESDALALVLALVLAVLVPECVGVVLYVDVGVDEMVVMSQPTN